MDRRRLCKVVDIPEDGTRGYPDADPARIVLVRRGERVFAYLNSCPHTGAPMEWRRHQFLALDDVHLCCGIHGAMFRPDDGFCVSGPCAGAYLTPAPIVLEDGWVVLDEA